MVKRVKSLLSENQQSYKFARTLEEQSQAQDVLSKQHGGTSHGRLAELAHSFFD